MEAGAQPEVWNESPLYKFSGLSGIPIGRDAKFPFINQGESYLIVPPSTSPERRLVILYLDVGGQNGISCRLTVIWVRIIQRIMQAATFLAMLSAAND
jgi:hypothetical protein